LFGNKILTRSSSQIGDYRSLSSETNVVLDHYSSKVGPNQDNAEDTMQINFNISFPQLSCEFASVDATNFMGTHDAGIATRVSKIHLDKSGRQLGPFTERKPVTHQDDLPPIQYKELEKSKHVNAHDFEIVRRQYQVELYASRLWIPRNAIG
jgi:hypothetical protein